MGNCQDQFHNIQEFETDNSKSEVLIDRSHKRIFATKYEKNVGFLMHQEDKQQFDNEVLHKSVALTRKTYIDKPILRKKQLQIQTPKLQLLDLKFYHFLGLPEYTYPNKPPQMQQGQWGKVSFIHQAQDRTGVVYIGERNLKGLFHGNGILKANTVHYIGQFFQGTKHNHGRQIYTNEVYEGQFRFDFRKGKGIRYTEDYVDEGQFDKLIIYGKRKFKNGNQYTGPFQNNQMHVTEKSEEKQKSSFIDAQNDLIYQQDLVIEEGKLIKAKVVKELNTNLVIGCFIDQQIIRKTDPRYKQIINNWSQLNVQDLVHTQQNQIKLKQDDFVRKRIDEWE